MLFLMQMVSKDDECSQCNETLSTWRVRKMYHVQEWQEILVYSTLNGHNSQPHNRTVRTISILSISTHY